MQRLSGDGIVDLGPGDERLEHVREHLRIRTRGHRRFLRAAQFGGRDGLHGLGDLPRVDYAADAPPDVENVCHFSGLSSPASVEFPWSLEFTGNRGTSYFAAACLESTNCCLASFMTLDISAFRLSSRTFFSMIVFSRPGFVVSTYLYRSFSKSLTWSTGMSSKTPLVPAKIIRICLEKGRGLNCPCFRSSTRRCPRFSCCWVALSRSLRSEER